MLGRRHASGALDEQMQSSAVGHSGTLLDSEEPNWIAWRDTIANEDIVITREQFLATFGQRNDSIIPAWLGSAASVERIERIGEGEEETFIPCGSPHALDVRLC